MQEYKDWLYLGLIIVFGAISHATKMAVMRKEGGIDLNWIDWLIALPTAMFSGLLFTLGAQYVSQDIVFHGLSGGIGAFLGLQGLNKLADVALNALTMAIKGKKDD